MSESNSPHVDADRTVASRLMACSNSPKQRN